VRLPRKTDSTILLRSHSACRVETSSLGPVHHPSELVDRQRPAYLGTSRSWSTCRAGRPWSNRRTPSTRSPRCSPRRATRGSGPSSGTPRLEAGGG